MSRQRPVADVADPRGAAWWAAADDIVTNEGVIK